jgi:hypothetical protein
MTKELTRGLNCPSCGGTVPVPEGVRIVVCPFCDQRSLVQGDQGVRRWQVPRAIGREAAISSAKGFFLGLSKAFDLRRSAHICEVFGVYLPYWRVSSFVSGWMFGRVRVTRDSTKPVELEIAEAMHWTDAAVDVSEFGVHRVAVHQQDLEPVDLDRLYTEAMVFEPTESRTEALAEAERHFRHRCSVKSKLDVTYFERLHLLRTQLSLVYYPLWVVRYEYHSRSYQVVVDGAKGQVLYGKAPGNILFRAAALVAGMAVGNFILVNGTLLVLRVLSDADDELGLAVLPIIAGAGLILAGYRAFRYGGEVEQTQKGAEKAALTVKPSVVEQLSEMIK